MAGMAVTTAPADGLYPKNGVSGGGSSTGAKSIQHSPLELNERRISAAIDRLCFYLDSNNTSGAEFQNLCLSLSRGIDFSVANHVVPKRSRELPSLLKKVCQTKNDALLQAATMVLMITVKSACQNGWFLNQDSEELNNLAKKVASNFCGASDFNAEPLPCHLHPSHQVISAVMSRFYPRLKMGRIFVLLEVKPGFDAYISVFQLSKNLKFSPGEKIGLFVVQTDSIEISSCLVTPAKVNFLLNGKGVERRNSLFVDPGPQVPTLLTPLLKPGSNLLQAVGEFNGNYIITVASMSVVPNPDSSTLQNCEQHAPATLDADSEVVEGPSRISLNCPISLKRIKTPVKGVSCKHIQCFDFDNYVDINSRRPSWRCPRCNQHVCFSDIRIDQKMVKILKDVGPKVSDVIVSSDGSWNAVMESEDTTEKSDHKTLNTGHGESPQPGDILDLTQTDDPMDDEMEDGKHSSEANAQTAAINTDNVNQSSTNHDATYWAEVYMSTFAMGSVNAQPNIQAAGPSASTSLLTESTSTNREAGAFHHNAVAVTSAPHSGTSLPNMLQFPPYQIGNPPVISDYGRLSSVPGHITRTPTAVQGLPAQTSTPFLQRGSTSGVVPSTTSIRAAASQASPIAPNSTTNRASSPQVPLMASSSPYLQHSSVQQNRSFAPGPSQQNAGFRDPNQVPNMFRSSNLAVNLRMPGSTSQSPQSGNILHPQGNAYMHGSGVGSGQQSNLAAANRAAQMSVGATRILPWQFPNTTTTSPVGDERGIGGATPSSQPAGAEMNWRPAGRMRGALTGQAYAKAFDMYITRPSQQAQAARSNGQPNLPASVVGARPAGGSDILPNASSRMQ